MEPALGTLTQFMGLRKVNTIGLEQANKCMHMAATAYNLKKYLKFIEKRAKSGAAALVSAKFAQKVHGPAFLDVLRPFGFTHSIGSWHQKSPVKGLEWI